MNEVTEIVHTLCQIGINDKGMMMKDISAKANMSNSFLSELSRGKKINVSLEKVLKLADAVGVKLTVNTIKSKEAENV